MGYARHVFRRPLCDYPGCGRPLEAAADWYFDMDTMVGDDLDDGHDGRTEATHHGRVADVVDQQAAFARLDWLQCIRQSDEGRMT